MGQIQEFEIVVKGSEADQTLSYLQRGLGIKAVVLVISLIQED